MTRKSFTAKLLLIAALALGLSAVAFAQTAAKPAKATPTPAAKAKASPSAKTALVDINHAKADEIKTTVTLFHDDRLNRRAVGGDLLPGEIDKIRQPPT